jgi:hypothetical protein
MKTATFLSMMILSLSDVAMNAEASNIDVLSNVNGDISQSHQDLAHVNRNTNPNATYVLQAQTTDSNGNPDTKYRPGAYLGNATSVNTDLIQADSPGLVFLPRARAKINENGPGNWNSQGSFATAPPTGKQGAETYKARASVNDPWSFDVESFAFSFMESVTLNAGLSVQALAPAGATASALFSADSSTDLDGLGLLWSLSFSANSGSPGPASFSFYSNPSLGLDDSAITATLEADISYDAASGTSTLTAPFSFSYDLTVPANSQPTFSSDVNYEVDGSSPGSTPEPLTCLLFGSGLMVISLLKRRSVAALRRKNGERWG